MPTGDPSGFYGSGKQVTVYCTSPYLPYTLYIPGHSFGTSIVRPWGAGMVKCGGMSFVLSFRRKQP